MADVKKILSSWTVAHPVKGGGTGTSRLPSERGVYAASTSNREDAPTFNFTPREPVTLKRAEDRATGSRPRASSFRVRSKPFKNAHFPSRTHPNQPEISCTAGDPKIVPITGKNIENQEKPAKTSLPFSFRIWHLDFRTHNPWCPPVLHHKRVKNAHYQGESSIIKLPI